MKRLFFVAVLTTSLTACATAPVGDSFTPVASIPDGKALVYIYRSDSTDRDYKIKANGTEIAKLARRQYVPYFAAPGIVELKADVVFKMFTTGLVDVGFSGKSIELETAAGHVYYVEGIDLGSSISHDLELYIRENEIGAEGIANCNLATVTDE